MRAVWLARPGGVSAEERPRPKPAAGQILLRTEACGLCASELDVFLDCNPWQQYPALLGHEVVGRVAAVGGAVEGWRAGDLVTAALAAGGYAEYLTVDAAVALLLVQLPRAAAPRWQVVAARRTRAQMPKSEREYTAAERTPAATSAADATTTAPADGAEPEKPEREATP